MSTLPERLSCEETEHALLFLRQLGLPTAIVDLAQFNLSTVAQGDYRNLLNELRLSGKFLGEYLIPLIRIKGFNHPDEIGELVQSFFTVLLRQSASIRYFSPSVLFTNAASPLMEVLHQRWKKQRAEKLRGLLCFETLAIEIEAPDDTCRIANQVDMAHVWEHIEAVVKNIDQLSVMRLTLFEDLSDAEIGMALGIREKKIKALRHQAVEKLRRHADLFRKELGLE